MHRVQGHFTADQSFKKFVKYFDNKCNQVKISIMIKIISSVESARIDLKKFLFTITTLPNDSSAHCQ